MFELSEMSWVEQAFQIQFQIWTNFLINKQQSDWEWLMKWDKIYPLATLILDLVDILVPSPKSSLISD